MSPSARLEYLQVGQAGGVVDRDVHLLVAGATGLALTPVAGHSVTDPLKPGQLFCVEMEHVARLFPLVPPNRRFGIEVSQSTQPQGMHHPSDGRERRL